MQYKKVKRLLFRCFNILFEHHYINMYMHILKDIAI